MIIYLATDHAGFQLKEAVKKFLIAEGYTIEDLGNFKYDENDDYPDFIHKAAQAISKCAQPVIASGAKQSYNGANVRSPRPEEARDDKCRAIILGGSGQGEAMVANRYKRVRAAVLYKFDKDIVRLSREHGDANVLSLGARFLKEKDALKAVKLWLETPFPGEERHRRRIAKF